MVSTRVGHKQEAGLSESCLDLIGEGTRGEAAVEGGGTGGRGELQHSSLKWAEKHKLYSQQNPDRYFIFNSLNCGSGHYQTPVMGHPSY